MKSTVLVALVSGLIAARGGYAQHTLGMHNHSGTGTSACTKGRYDGPIEKYPKDKAGDLFHKVSTSIAAAQQYFNQGLTFFYGFDSESAMRSFYQASLNDPGLAMAHWGIALAAGGDLNIPIDDPCMTLAIQESATASKLAGGASTQEKLYIAALAKRYASGMPPSAVRDVNQLGVMYTLAMRSVYNQIGSQDPDAAALYGYSLMNLRPWYWWTTWGEKTAEIEATLSVADKGLKQFGNHIGLNHIKIHAQEEGPVKQAAEAKPSAEFLFRAAPLIAPHLRHMPSHIFLLLGDWENVVESNRRAMAADLPWAEKCKSGIANPECNQLLVGHYYSHDMLFLAVGLSNRGAWSEVLPLAKKLEANTRSFIDTQPGLEHYLTTQVMMMVRFGMWQDLVDLPPPPVRTVPADCRQLKYPLATSMWFFGRVMGNASLRKPFDNGLAGFQKAQACVRAAGTGWGNNTGSDILDVVHWRMLERIARLQGDHDASLRFALLGVETEELLNYDEPPGWYLSSRENYGAALYASGRYKESEDAFTNDLARHPNSSRSLYGMWQSLAKQGKPVGPARDAFMRQWQVGVPVPNLGDM